jgi:hypothetical protein
MAMDRKRPGGLSKAVLWGVASQAIPGTLGRSDMAEAIRQMLRILAAGVVTALVSTSAWADGGRTGSVFSCENGRAYPLVPVAVSDAGDIVTARLYTAPHRAVAVRLIPMGSGYRYAGRGIWLDGIRNQAVLNFGKSTAISCEMTPPMAW